MLESEWQTLVAVFVLMMGDEQRAAVVTVEQAAEGRLVEVAKE